MFKHKLLLSAILFMLQVQIYSSMGNNAQRFANQTSEYVAVPAYYHSHYNQQMAAYNNMFYATTTQNNGAQASEAVSEQEFFENDASAAAFSNANAMVRRFYENYHPSTHDASQVYFASNNNGQQNVNVCLCPECQANNQDNSQNDDTYQNQSYNYQQQQQQIQPYFVENNNQTSIAPNDDNDDKQDVVGQMEAPSALVAAPYSNTLRQLSLSVSSTLNETFNIFCFRDTKIKESFIDKATLAVLNAPFIWVHPNGYRKTNYIAHLVLQKRNPDQTAFQALLDKGIDCTVIEENKGNLRYHLVTLLHVLALVDPSHFSNLIPIFRTVVNKVPAYYPNLQRGDGKTAAKLVMINKYLDDQTTLAILQILMEASKFTINADDILKFYHRKENKPETVEYLMRVRDQQQRVQSGQLIAGGGAVASASNNNDDE